MTKEFTVELVRRAFVMGYSRVRFVYQGASYPTHIVATYGDGDFWVMLDPDFAVVRYIHDGELPHFLRHLLGEDEVRAPAKSA